MSKFDPEERLVEALASRQHIINNRENYYEERVVHTKRKVRRWIFFYRTKRGCHTERIFNQKRYDEDLRNAGIEINQAQKEIEEVKRELIAMEARITKNVADNFREVNKRLEEARKHREEISRENNNKLMALNQQIFESRKSANEAFEKASFERSNLYKKSAEEQKINQERLEILRRESNEKFEKAKQHRDEIYRHTSKELENTKKDILKNREEIDRRFNEAKIERETKFKQQQDQFLRLNKSYQDLTTIIDREFKLAKEHREQNYSNSMIAIKETKNEVLNSVNEIVQDFGKTRDYLEKEFRKNEESIKSLSAAQKASFLEARKDREKIELQLIEFRNQANQKFEEASIQQQQTNLELKSYIEAVEQQVLKSRKEAEDKFKEATRQRIDIYTKAQDQLNTVNKEILLSRKLADAKFEEAANQRILMQEKITEEIGENREEIFKSRAEAEVRFQEASKNRQEIYRKTETKIEEVNKNVNNLQERCEINFDKAEEHRERVYEETNKRLDKVNNSINEINIKHEKHFAEIKVYNENIQKRLAEKTSLLEEERAIEGNVIEKLQELKEQTREKLNMINEGEDQRLLDIKTFKFTKYIGSDDTKKIQSQNKNLEDKNQSSASLQIQSTNIKLMLDAAIKAAKSEGERYDLKLDKFQIKIILKQELKLDLDMKSRLILEEMHKGGNKLIEILKEIEELKNNLKEMNIDINSGEVLKENKELESLNKSQKQYKNLAEKKLSFEEKNKQLTVDELKSNEAQINIYTQETRDLSEKFSSLTDVQRSLIAYEMLINKDYEMLSTLEKGGLFIEKIAQISIAKNEQQVFNYCLAKGLKFDVFVSDQETLALNIIHNGNKFFMDKLFSSEQNFKVSTFFACAKSDFKTLDILLQYDAQALQKFKEVEGCGFGVLQYAVACNDAALIDYAIKHDTNCLKDTVIGHESYLQMALDYNDHEVINLIAKSSDLNQEIAKIITTNQIDLFDRLVANVELPQEKVLSILKLCIDKNCFSIAEIIVEKIKDIKGEFLKAVHTGDIELISALISLKSDQLTYKYISGLMDNSHDEQTTILLSQILPFEIDEYEHFESTVGDNYYLQQDY